MSYVLRAEKNSKFAGLSKRLGARLVCQNIFYMPSIFPSQLTAIHLTFPLLCLTRVSLLLLGLPTHIPLLGAGGLVT